MKAFVQLLHAARREHLRLVLLLVSAPSIELVATLESQGPDRLAVSLHRVEGSMLDTFAAKPGSALGTVVLEAGQPKNFVLGGALLPNEIGPKEATVLKLRGAS